MIVILGIKCTENNKAAISWVNVDSLILECRETINRFNKIERVIQNAKTQGFSQEVVSSMNNCITEENRHTVFKLSTWLDIFTEKRGQSDGAEMFFSFHFILKKLQKHKIRLETSNKFFMEKYDLDHLEKITNHLASCYAWYHTIILLRKEIMKLGKDIFQLYGQSPRPEEELEQLNKRLIIMTNNLQQAELEWSQWTSSCAELQIR